MSPSHNFYYTSRAGGESSQKHIYWVMTALYFLNPERKPLECFPRLLSCFSCLDAFHAIIVRGREGCYCSSEQYLRGSVIDVIIANLRLRSLVAVEERKRRVKGNNPLILLKSSRLNRQEKRRMMTGRMSCVQIQGTKSSVLILVLTPKCLCHEVATWSDLGFKMWSQWMLLLYNDFGYTSAVRSLIYVARELYSRSS